MDFLSLLNFLIFAYKYQPSVDWQELTFLYPDCNEESFQNKIFFLNSKESGFKVCILKGLNNVWNDTKVW